MTRRRKSQLPEGNSKMIYYAHSRKIYNTKREKKELQYLRKLYGKVLDPNNDLGELEDTCKYMRHVAACTLVVCSEYLDHVGFGVFMEVLFALNNDIPVMCLRKNKSNNQFQLHMVHEIKLKGDNLTRFGVIE